MQAYLCLDRRRRLIGFVAVTRRFVVQSTEPNLRTPSLCAPRKRVRPLLKTAQERAPESAARACGAALCLDSRRWLIWIVALPGHTVIQIASPSLRPPSLRTPSLRVGRRRFSRRLYAFIHEPLHRVQIQREAMLDRVGFPCRLDLRVNSRIGICKA